MHRGISVVATVLVALLALSGCARTVAGTAIPAPSGARAADDGAVRIGTGGPTITVYLDLLCPACKNFETTYGAEITAAVRGGRLTVEYRPVSFLDRQSASGDYSSRALAAFLLVGRSGGTDATLGFLTSMFLSQPEEGGSSDLTNAEIATLAGASGTVDAAVATIRDGSTGIDGRAVGAANLQLLTAAGGTGTPTVLHDGAQVTLTDSGWLQKIVG